MNTRRGFLAALGLGGVGLSMSWKAKAAAKTYPKPAAKRGPFLTLSWMTREVALEMQKALGDYKTTYRPYALGTEKHYHVSLEPVNPTVAIDEWRTRYAVPAGMTLAATIKEHNLRVLCDLPIPEGGVEAYRLTSKTDGLALRGLKVYDIKRDQYFTRFDVLGATA